MATKLSSALVLFALAAGCHGRSMGPEDRTAWEECAKKDGVGALDGQRFEVDTGVKGKGAEEKETMEFHGGRFHSVGCDEYRFETGAYSTTKSGDAVAFQSATKSPTEGSISWNGTVRGDAIDGTYTWTKSGQAPIEYWFKGTRRR